jgi:carbonic anhydrase
MFAGVANLERILEENDRYAEREHERLPAVPSRQLVVITCMDTRVDPYAALGLRPGEAHILRNAGGIVTRDVLRSLIVSHNLLGTEEAIVLMHTDCGLSKNRDRDIRRVVREKYGHTTRTRFECFDSLEDALARSVAAIEQCTSLSSDFAVTGLVFDVADGRVKRPTAP